MRAGRIVLLVAGVLIALVGAGSAAAGSGALWIHATQRDADGYLTTPDVGFETSTRAITTEELELVAEPGTWTWRDGIDLRLQVTPADPATDVFVGVAPRADVQSYLDGVAHDQITRVDVPQVDYRSRPGDRIPAPPGEQDIWAASTEGSGTQTLTWTAQPGTWTVVLMNADASAGLAVSADVGARTDLLLPIAVGLLIAGLALLAAGAAMIIAAAATSEERPAGVPARVPPTPAGSARPYPVAVTGHLDPHLSRWQWLVKWLLLIPHVIVLAFLWLAFVVLTFVAGVAILVTGRYPKGIFDFNVGVLRWTWRVTFYGYGALGTDRYPPFALEEAEHPAHLDVAYPAQLSRGLVLIKWWLLALPHYLIIGLFTGGGLAWTFRISAEESWRISLGGGLIGLLVLVAGLALLVTARYPAGLFALVVGLNRWVYRVVAYAALMTDEYPPFRLDMGGEEPGPVAPRPPASPHDTGARPRESVRH